jgi:hypothetical protein
MSTTIEQQSRLRPDQLRWYCSHDLLPFETTADIDPAEGVVGQPTAKEALRFGLQCLTRGQNIYVRGARGTGRIDMVHQLLAELAPATDDKRDFCYVHNFQRPDHPRLITLPPGQAYRFRQTILKLVDFFAEGLRSTLESEPHLSRRQAIQEEIQKQVREISLPLEDDLKQAGLALVSVPQGQSSQTMILPVLDGEPMPPEQLRLLIDQGKVPEEILTNYEETLPQYQKRMQDTGRQVNELLREGAKQLTELTESVIRSLAGNQIQPILDRYANDNVAEFLKDIVDDLVERWENGPPSMAKNEMAELYGVNVVLCQKNKTARPIVEENTPSLINLLGVGGTAISTRRDGYF